MPSTASRTRLYGGQIAGLERYLTRPRGVPPAWSGTAESTVDQAVRPNEWPGGAGLLTCNRLPPAGETYTQGWLVDRAHRDFTRIRVLRGIHSMPVMRIV